MGHGDSVDTARVETLLKAPQDSFFCVVYNESIQSYQIICVVSARCNFQVMPTLKESKSCAKLKTRRQGTFTAKLVWSATEAKPEWYHLRLLSLFKICFL